MLGDVYKRQEYRMVPVDQAAGSRYYVLLLVQADGKTGEVVNSDPYLGMGGAAKWIHFLDDGKTGFSCLSYSGGAKGAFYRTADGGKPSGRFPIRQQK